jgi:hypothetical protein
MSRFKDRMCQWGSCREMFDYRWSGLGMTKFCDKHKVIARRYREKIWYQNNKEKVKTSNNIWYHNNKESQKITIRKYYLNNKDNILDYGKKYREEHREELYEKRKEKRRLKRLSK